MIIPTGKYELQLNLPGEGKIFLNWWDYVGGDDVVVDIVDGKLFLHIHDEEGEVVERKEISFPEFLEKVFESINNQKA